MMGSMAEPTAEDAIIPIAAPEETTTTTAPWRK